MIKHQEVYLPDGEVHMVQWMTESGEIIDGKGTYQIKKLRKATSYCTQFRHAVDIGAHVGLWTMKLVELFSHVTAFEPVAEHRDCWYKNTNSLQGGSAYLHGCALGEHVGMVNMVMPEEHSSGSTMVNGDGNIPLRRLDDFNLVEVDFIKLDCEGYELFALRGGEQTIRNNKPVIIVEQKPGRAQRFGLAEKGAVSYLQGLGYNLATEMSGDFIMVPSP